MNSTDDGGADTFISSVPDTAGVDETVGFRDEETDCPTPNFEFLVQDTNGPGYDFVCGAKNPFDGAWHHVTGVYDVSSNLMRLYVDGLETSVSITANSSGTKNFTGYPFYIGAENRQGSADNWIIAKIDEVRIYNRALSAAEVRYLYNKGKPIAHWKFDEGSGSTAFDSANNAGNGTITGATYTTGQYGTSLDFDGTDDNVNVADTAVLDFDDTADMTISGWFNRDTATTDDVIVAKRNGIASTDTGYIAYLDDATDTLIFEVSDATDEYQLESSATFTSTGWNHFTIVWDQDSAANSEIYINGRVDSAADTRTIANIGTLANAVALRIATESDGGNPFDGKLDDVRIYNYARTAEEIRVDYNTGLSAHFR